VISTRALFQAVALAVVLTRSVPVPVPLPGLTEAGLKLQAAAGGTPAVQDNDTEPVNSEWPLSAIAKSAACPAMTVLEGGGPPKSNEGKRSKVADALLGASITTEQSSVPAKSQFVFRRLGLCCGTSHASK
jgi:hypothetical protein